jgi:hypothetical protein
MTVGGSFFQNMETRNTAKIATQIIDSPPRQTLFIREYACAGMTDLITWFMNAMCGASLQERDLKKVSHIKCPNASTAFLASQKLL